MLRGHRTVWCLTIWPLVASGLSSCPQLQHPLAVCLGQSAFIPQFVCLQNGSDNSTQLRGLMWELDVILYSGLGTVSSML